MTTALITGATSGIGLAFSRALASEGYDLVLVARGQARLMTVATELASKYGVRCEEHPADLSDLEETRTVEKRLMTAPVDLLVNNAGFGLGRTFHKTDIEAEQASMDVLVRAVMRLTHAALPPMLDRGSGEIVNVSSVAGFLPRGSYAANKAWVTSFSAWANARYKARGVKVMALCPGFTHTEFHQRMGANMSGVKTWMWLDADDLVRVALRDLRAGKAISIPSLRYKAAVAAARIAPRGLVEKAARRGR
ncbi:MAG: SDR family NAD(P)-dependent oxidoreductase [Nocardioidaceae bacterium]